MKHVCFITYKFNREDALNVYRQGATLVDNGFKVSYLLCDGLPTEVKRGIEMVSVGTLQGNALAKIRKSSSLLYEYAVSHPADVYQICDPELLPLGLKLKKKGASVVYNLREYYPDYFSRKFKNKFLQKLTENFVRSYLRYYSKRIDAIFNCMPEMGNIRKEMPCRFFEDVANFPVVNRDFSLSFEEYASRENIISYFGSIYTISCQEEFLEAIDTIPNVKYLLAGVFYDDSYKKALMSKHGWEKVIFKDGFTRDELPGIINASIMGNVMKDFNKTETPQGSYSIIKIFESMEAAIPVILSKVELYEAMVEKYHCGICVDPHNVEEVRNAIIYLLEHKEEAYQMGQNGRRAVIEEFSWDSQAKGYIKIIKELTNQ